MFKKLNILMKQNGYSLRHFDKFLFQYTNDGKPSLALIVDIKSKVISPAKVNLDLKTMVPSDISLKLCSEIYQILRGGNNV